MRHHGKIGLLKRSLALAALPAAGLALLALPGPVSAAEATEITIAAPASSVASGDRVNVDILVAPGSAIAGLQLDLRFDPELFAVESVKQGDLFIQDGASAFFNAGHIDNREGIITGAFSAITSPGQTVSGSGTFATITLQAIADSPACRVVLSGVLVGDIDGNPMPSLVTNNGSLDAGAPTTTFSWWALGLIIAAAVAVIAAVAAGLLYRRHLLLKAPEGY